MVDNVPVNGIGYTKLIQYLVKALNTRGLTEIQNTWERIVQVEMKGVLKNAFSIFENGTKALEGKLPLEDGEFYTHMYNIKIAAGVELNKFRYSTSKCNLMREIFDKRVRSEEDGLISKNQMQSKKICQDMSRQIISQMNIRLSTDDLSEMGPGYAHNKFADIKNDYLERAMGSYKYDILMNDIANNFILQLEQLYEKKNGHVLQERNTYEIQAKQYEGKYEASKLLLEKQRDMSEALMHQTKSGYSDQLKFYEEKIDIMKTNFEGRLVDTQTQLREVKDQTPRDKPQKVINENLVNFAEVKRMNENFKTLMGEIKKMADIDTSEKVTNLLEKEKLKMEGRFQAELFKFKKTNDMELDKIKHSYEREMDGYKEQNKNLQIIRQENLSIILQKEAEIRLLQEKIRNEEKQKHSKAEQADMMCKISDKVYHMLKKIEQKAIN